MTSTTEAAKAEGMSMDAGFDVERIRADFPALHQCVNGHPLVYLDSAATAQKPQAVIDKISEFYETCNANIHRGVHTLSVRATEAYEGARAKTQRLIGAQKAEEIIFTRSATEAINLVAHSFGQAKIGPGDEILISTMEHHSNIVPWQLLCERSGAILRVVPLSDNGEIEKDQYEKLLGPATKLVALTHVSNALGTINPVAEMIAAAHVRGAVVLLDGAQAVPHMKVDVVELDCDFYAFSSHKMFGPTGVGVLYGKADLLDAMPPYQGGGEMIKHVTFDKTIYNDLPHKFEAGTPNIAGVVGLSAAVDFLEEIGLGAIEAYEQDLLAYGTEALGSVARVQLIGTAKHKAAVLSFVLDGIHAHDVGTILDQQGIAVRTGHHCAQPVMDRFGVAATTRASLALYNTRGEIDALVAALEKVVAVLG